MAIFNLDIERFILAQNEFEKEYVWAVMAGNENDQMHHNFEVVQSLQANDDDESRAITKSLSKC